MAELLYINGGGTDLYGSTRVCHSFTPDDDWTVESVWIDNIWGNDSTGKLSIYDDNSGEPGSELHAAGDETIATSGPGSAETWTFSPSVELDNGVKYWLVWRCGTSSNAIYGYRTTSSVYSDGEIGYSGDQGSSWVIHTSFDLRQLKINGTVGHAGGGGATPLSSAGLVFDPAIGIFRKAGETDTILSKGDTEIGNDQNDQVTITSSGTLLTAAGALTLRDGLVVSGTGNITGNTTIGGNLTTGGTLPRILFDTTSGTIGISGDIDLIQLANQSVTVNGSFYATSLSGTYYGDGSNLIGIVSDHGALTGLTDDDHMQYAPLTGVRAFTGDVTISGGLTATGNTIIGGTSSSIQFTTTSGNIGVSTALDLIQLDATDGVTFGGSNPEIQFSTTSGTIGVSNDADLIQLDGTTGVTINGNLHVSTGWTGSIPTISGTITVVDGIITNYS